MRWPFLLRLIGLGGGSVFEVCSGTLSGLCAFLVVIVAQVTGLAAVKAAVEAGDAVDARISGVAVRGVGTPFVGDRRPEYD